MAPVRDTDRLQAAFEVATARLESEKESIESELSALSRLRAGLGVVPTEVVCVA